MGSFRVEKKKGSLIYCARKIFRKTFLTPDTHTHVGVRIRGVRNISFSENLRTY